MKNLKEIGSKAFTIDSKEEWHQLAGKEMSAFFGKNVYFIFFKYDRTSIERAFDIAKKENNREFSHFMNNVVKG